MNCEKDLVQGSDAMIYEEMEITLKDLIQNDIEKEKMQSFKTKFMQICDNVDRAIANGINQIQNNTNKEAIRELLSMRKFLAWPFYDKIKLDQVIERASGLFKENGLVV